MITSPVEITSVFSTSRSEARMVGVRSSATQTSIALGIEARNWGSSAFIRSTVAMMLAPGWRLIVSSTDGRPLAEPALRRSCTESFTSARSDSRTGVPSR